MRRTSTLAVLLVLLVAACGGSDTTEPTAPVPAETAAAATEPASTEPATTELPDRTDAPTTAPPDTAPADPEALTGATVAQQLSGAGLGCDDYTVTVDDPNETSMTLAPEPEMEEGTCTGPNGESLGITVFDDADQARIANAQLDLYGSMAIAFGVLEIGWVEAGPDGRVWVDMDPPAEEVQPRLPQSTLALFDQIADALDGRVIVREL